MINYPYLPEGRTIQYVSDDNPCMAYMMGARRVAQERSLDKAMPGGAVIVKGGAVLGMGANGSDYHERVECKRVKLGCKSGEGYELCEGCSSKNHSERRAIEYARQRGHDTKGADLYLWGHWWCCESCWSIMIEAGIENVYLLEGSEILFNKEHPDNIVGRQFEATE